MKRQPGWMYFVKNGDVYGVPSGTPMSRATLVAKAGVVQEPGFLYYVDVDGDIARKDTSKPAAPPPAAARPASPSGGAHDDDDDDDGDDDDGGDDDEEDDE